MSLSPCVAQLGPGVAAYNSAVGSKRLCEALDNAGIAMPCPPTPAMLDLLDRKVLCAIFCCCMDSPNISSKGARLYQNCVAATLKAGQIGDVNQPAHHMSPEVSYSMKTVPPTPVGKYFDAASLRAATKAEYEAATGLRRPDVVVRRPGANGGLSGDVIQKVWEMKFPGDSYSDGQRQAYEEIAGEDKKFDDLDKKKCCDGKEEKQAERLLNAAKSVQDAARSKFFLSIGLIGLGALLGGIGGLLGGEAVGVAGGLAGAM